MVRGKYRGRPYSDFLCSYCGLRPSDDMDHAVAQALFNKPLRAT